MMDGGLETRLCKLPTCLQVHTALKGSYCKFCVISQRLPVVLGLGGVWNVILLRPAKCSCCWYW